jgi:hypothetical protein
VSIAVHTHSDHHRSAVGKAALGGGLRYSLWEEWIIWSIALYILTGAFWLPVVWMQMRMCGLAAEAVHAGEPHNGTISFSACGLPSGFLRSGQSWQFSG